MECDATGDLFTLMATYFNISLSLMTTALFTGESDVHPALRNAVHHAH